MIVGGRGYKNFRIPKYKSSNEEINVDTGYTPRPLQAYLHRSLKRFNVVVCHRRFGKTIFSINEMIDQALRNDNHNPQYAYIAPTYKQAKMIAWEYLINYTKNIPGVEVNKTELTVTIYRPDKDDKIKFILLGADNPDSIRGIYLDGVILDEYAQCDPSIWGEIIVPTLADRKGWAIFIGTPKGQNHFFEIYVQARKQHEMWFNCLIKASESGVLDQEELSIMRATMTNDEYDQELECNFQAALKGSYYGEIINRMYEGTPTRISDIPYNPAFPVDTFWDIGVGDDCTIVFRQKIGPAYYYIDYYSNNRQGLEHYVGVLKAKGYLYGRHVFPHDMKVQEFGTGQTRLEQARKMGLNAEIQAKQSIDDGIAASRNRLSTCFIDRTKCAKMIDCLKNYEREYDSKNKVFKTSPKHNWASHGASAFRYSALDDRDSTFAGNTKRELLKKCIMDYNELE